MISFKKTSQIAAVLLVLFLSIACGLNSNDATTGSLSSPKDDTSFDNVEIKFNPTISFRSKRFSYLNTESATEFPSGNNSGSFSYTKVSSSQGNLSLTFSDNTVVPLALTGFSGSATAITSFTVASASGKAYSASLNSGTLAPEVTTTTAATSTSTTTTSTASASLPSALSGKLFNLKYSLITANSNVPYTDGETVEFVFSSSGALFIKRQGETTAKEISTFELIGTTYTYLDSNSVKYAVSVVNDALNEINVSRGAFAGQFAK